MDTFFISFNFNNTEQKAEVLKRKEQTETEYDVRPSDPLTVRTFGKQIRIFKNKNKYNTHNHIAVDHKEFFNSLVNAIRLNDEQAVAIKHSGGSYV